MFYIWELNTLYSCVKKKPEPFWAEHKHSNVYEVYFCGAVSRAGFCRGEGPATSSRGPFHGRQAAVPSRKSIHFHTFTRLLK